MFRESVFSRVYQFVSRWLVCVFLGGSALATSPQLNLISPAGAQRGTAIEMSFTGERLQDVEEVISYEPGIQFDKLTFGTNGVVTVQAAIATNCSLGEHHLRLRAASGVSELRTFFVGSLPVVNEIEPNNDQKTAQKLSLNMTVAGVLKNEDVDFFSIELKQGQRFSAEVQGIRLGRANFDARLIVHDEHGGIVADVDDTCLALQDPFLSFNAPSNGVYVIELRDVTYGGSDNSHYLLHVGTFARPQSVFPPGGQSGQTVAFGFRSDVTGWFTNQVPLPAETNELFGIYGELDGSLAPSPNWIRVCPFPNVLATGTNQSREQATVTDIRPPVALNGIIFEKGQENWFRFPAVKDQALTVKVFARKLRSPLDSAIDICDVTGKSIASDDDAGGVDSNLKFTPAESTNYFLRIRDTLGNGGVDFTYRVEVEPVKPSLTVQIPEVARNDTQSRQWISVPRGNRFATLISAKRANFESSLAFSMDGMPQGTTMLADRMEAKIDSMPLVFEAAPDAPLGGKLLNLVASGTNSQGDVLGHFRQTVELVQGPPNNANYYSTSVEKIYVAATRKVPFKLRIVEPKVPLVQAGSMRLEVVAERATNFDEPIELKMVWNPPGISSQSETSIAKGATNAFYQLNAGGGAETREWKIAVLGHAQVEGGPVYVSTQLAKLEVARPFVTGKIETLWLSPGKSGKLTVNLDQQKPFEGKAKIRLAGLPDKVTAPEQEISSADKEVVFDVTVDGQCTPASHKNLFCALDIKQGDELIPHTIAAGGILRIVPAKKAEPKIASAEGSKK